MKGKMKITSIIIIIFQIISINSYSQDTLVLQPNGICGKDATLSSKWPNNNSGAHPDFIAAAWTHSGTPSTVRGLLEFDLSSIPSNSTVISAELSLFWSNNNLNLGHSSLNFPNIAHLKRVTSPWDENTVTWNTEPTSTNTNMILLPESINGTQDYPNIDVTSLTQDMINNPSNSFGFLFKQTAEQYYRSMLFASSDFPDPTKHPKIVIIYNSNGNLAEDLSLGNDTTLCPGSTLTLAPNISGINNYLWQDGSTSATFPVSSPGTYSLEVTTCTGIFSDTINITYNNTDFTGLGNDTTLCSSNTYLLEPNLANSSYIWQDGSTTPSLLVHQSGQYWIDIYDNDCLLASDTINIDFYPELILNIGNDTLLCTGTSLTLSPTTNSINGLEWQDGSTNSNFEVIQSGIYWVKTDNICETIADTIEIEYNPSHFDGLGNDTILCNNQPYIIDAEISNGVYIWQNNSSTPNITINQSGTYWVDVYSNGCFIGSDTILIDYPSPLNLNLGNDTILCPGDVLHLTGDSINTNLWNNGSTNPNYHIIQSGIYWLQVSNYCETVTDTIQIDYDSNIFNGLGNDTVLCNTQTYLLETNVSNGTYLWHDNSVNPNFLVNQTGTYWVDVYSNECFIGSDTLSIFYPPPLNINLGNDTILCPGNTLSLIGDTINTNTWQDGSINTDFEVSQSGSYWVELTNFCESISDTILITYDTNTFNGLGNDTILCTNQTYNLEIDVNDATYIWQDNSINSNFLINQAGIYWVDVLSNGCFIGSDTINISYPNSLNVNLGSDTTLCENSPLILVPITNSSINYTWQDGSTDSILEINQSGTYWVEISNLCEIASDTIVVSQSAPIQLFLPDIESCENTMVEFNFSVIPLNNSIVSYTWNFGDNTISTEESPIHNYSNTTLYNYSLTVEDSLGCQTSTNATIELHDNPIANFNFHPDQILQNDPIHFNNLSNNETTWLWSFDNIFLSTKENPIHIFNTAGNHYVELMVQNEYCIDSIKKKIIVLENIIFHVPNAFTPDNDHMNNSFLPIFSPDFIPTDYHLTIFNRWGETIFESFDQSIGWDGSYVDSPSTPTGVFIWKLEFKENLTDKRHLEIGHVTLLK